MSNYAKFELSHHHKGLHMWMMLDLMDALPTNAVLSHSGDDVSKSVSYYTFRSKKFQKLDEAEMIPSVVIVPDYTNKRLRFSTTNATLRSLFGERSYDSTEVLAIELSTPKTTTGELVRFTAATPIEQGLTYFDEVIPNPPPPAAVAQNTFTWRADPYWALPNGYYTGFVGGTTNGNDNG